MSIVTSLLGLDGIISAVRRKAWYDTILELQELVARYADKKTAANVDEFLLILLASGVIKKPLPPAVSVGVP